MDDGRDWVEAKVVKRSRDGHKLSLRVEGFGICEDVPLTKVVCVCVYVGGRAGVRLRVEGFGICEDVPLTEVVCVCVYVGFRAGVRLRV